MYDAIVVAPGPWWAAGPALGLAAPAPGTSLGQIGEGTLVALFS
jgi:hypothetical protein